MLFIFNTLMVGLSHFWCVYLSSTSNVWVHCNISSKKFQKQICGLYLQYSRPFVSKLWHDIRAVFCHVYLQSFLLHDIRAFFCHVYLRSFLLCGVFIPKYMTIFFQTPIYMRAKKPICMRYRQACVYGVTESRRIKGTELYRQQKTSSSTMELKCNFSLNHAWPQ